jgi:hypothetical protein
MGVIKATIDMNGLRRWIKNQAKDVIRAVQVCKVRSDEKRDAGISNSSSTYLLLLHGR